MKTTPKVIGAILQLIGGALCLYMGLTGIASGEGFIVMIAGLVLILVGYLMSKSKN